MDAVDVKKLSEQLDAVHSLLDEIRVTSGCASLGSALEPAQKPSQSALQTAQRVYHERRSRVDFLGNNEIFGEPAWDMLLNIFIRQSTSEMVSFESADINKVSPKPTAVRWLRVLEQSGLIRWERDADDNDRHLIYLTATGYEGMLRYLESIAV
ncbi:hypothetical protein [Porphyrobacter sp. AAP60]|uniref:hypothetical protein n=1 Tax=Porphyrobacter sp. AAP60 TaxID=1523423 RepID=UPI0006B9B2D0|nr:hypothetical protein [Porphyrobacter sp. AAP60]